jgi:hypothetical protein
VVLRTLAVVGERAERAGAGPSAGPLTGPSCPVLIRRTAPDALSNLVAVLELAADGQLRCSAATRRPFRATVDLVEDALVGGDYYDDESIAAFAWPLLLQAGGLARLAGTELELTARGRAVLARPAYQALGALWDRWLASVSLDELSRIEAIRGQHRPATLTSAAARRTAVAAALATVRPGAWTDVSALLSIMRARGSRFAVTTSLLALWRLFVTDPYYGSLGHAGPVARDLIEDRYARCVLFEYAATIGLIDVGYTDPRGARDDFRALWGTDGYACLSRYDGLVAVRVNELGAAILHHPDGMGGLSLPGPRRG